MLLHARAARSCRCGGLSLRPESGVAVTPGLHPEDPSRSSGCRVPPRGRSCAGRRCRFPTLRAVASVAASRENSRPATPSRIPAVNGSDAGGEAGGECCIRGPIRCRSFEHTGAVAAPSPVTANLICNSGGGNPAGRHCSGRSPMKASRARGLFLVVLFLSWSVHAEAVPPGEVPPPEPEVLPTDSAPAPPPADVPLADAQEQDHQQAIGFDDFGGVMTSHGTVTGTVQWSSPYEGKYKGPLVGVDFYRAVGRSDCVKQEPGPRRAQDRSHGRWRSRRPRRSDHPGQRPGQQPDHELSSDPCREASPSRPARPRPPTPRSAGFRGGGHPRGRRGVHRRSRHRSGFRWARSGSASWPRPTTASSGSASCTEPHADAVDVHVVPQLLKDGAGVSVAVRF